MAEEPTSWLTITDNSPVLDAEGNLIGNVTSVLGDDENDIFHGLAVDRKGLFSGVVEVPAARVDRITTETVYTNLAPSEIEGLEAFEEDKWFDFEGVSRFFKRPKWREDS